MAQEQSQVFSAPGLVFFEYLIFANSIVITLLGISYYSSAITEEKEEDTLGLMTMAGISPLGILLGKSTTRLFQTFLLLALQLPLTILAITLGGLTIDQVYIAFAALMAYTILLSNVGLFCSVFSRRNRDAAAMTTLIMLGYMLTPLFASAYATHLKSEGSTSAQSLIPVLEWIMETNIFRELILATQTGRQFELSPQLISNSLSGLILFLLSWPLLNAVAQEPPTEVATRISVPKPQSRLRALATGRAWDAALIWKDFHFTAGGWMGILGRCVLYTSVYGLIIAATYPWNQDGIQYPISWTDVTSGFQIFVLPLLTLDCAVCASRFLEEEIRSQSLSSLIMMPGTVHHLVYSKAAGVLLGITPGIVAAFIAFFLLPEHESSIAVFFRDPQYWWYLASLILVCHLSGLLSTYLRWGAFVMSLVITIGMITMFQILGAILNPNGLKSGYDLGAIVMVGIILAVCVACHLSILLRLPKLAAK